MATKKKTYGAAFSREMGRDPNMGMNPKWRKAQAKKGKSAKKGK